jgi:4-diphosphocytidyl-2-C-methyl-D-erythritol kinase
MTLCAYAKINLYLRVVGRRPDGYHEIETLFHSIRLADTLSFDAAPAGQLLLECDDPSLPPDESNLVCRAAAALRAAAGVEAGARIRLAKRIPMGAGLGGGSSDAAATLVGLCRLWGLSLDAAALHALAAGLGSDVPFFLRGGAALATGRGELLIPLPDAPPLALVLVSPPFEVGTPWAYRAWRPVPDGPSAAACREALARGDRQALAAALRNDLEPGVVATHPELETIRQRLRAAGALGARMTGSGSTLFALARDAAHALRIAAAVSDLPGTVRVTETVPATEAGLLSDRVL